MTQRELIRELIENLERASKCAKYCHAKHPDIQKGDGVPAFLFWDELLIRAKKKVSSP